MQKILVHLFSLRNIDAVPVTPEKTVPCYFSSSTIFYKYSAMKLEDKFHPSCITFFEFMTLAENTRDFSHEMNRLFKQMTYVDVCFDLKCLF